MRFGDRVVVEHPGFPPFLDLLDVLGAVAVPVALDEQGMIPEALAVTLRSRPVAVLVQPRAQNPTGASMTPTRAEALARVIRSDGHGDELIVIEDDHSGMISTEGDVTLGTWLPAQVVHVRSFSKSHGPDLRIAALGGPRELIDRIVARRMLGPGWTSRMLQTILLDLLTDGASIDAVAEARRAVLLAAARPRRRAAGARSGGGAGRRDEPVDAGAQRAVGARAARGRGHSGGGGVAVPRGVANGRMPRRRALAFAAEFVRVTVGMVRDGVDEVADALATAAQHVVAGGY